MTGKRELIDWHTHCWRPEHVGKATRDEMRAYGVIGGEAWPELHAKCLEEAKVDKFVLINAPTRKGKEVPNDFIAEYVAGYPNRAVGLASVDPHTAGAPREFERSITELGLKGLKLSPVYQAFDPHSSPAMHLFEIAASHDVPVMFHMGGAYPPSASLNWSSPLLLDKIGRMFPNLRMIVAHFGQPMMEETVVLMRKNKNVWADLSARFHRPWQLYNGLRVAMEYKVTDRLLFGSDFPVMTTKRAIEGFTAINDWGEGVNVPRIPDELIDEILYERPFELLGW